MNASEYWQECIAVALDEAGVIATIEQINEIADTVEGAHECYGMAFYQPENPLIGELKEAKQALKAEQDLVFCQTCRGSGSLTSHGPYHSATSSCWKCNGNGKHKP